MDDVSLPWGQQVAVMFQIVSTLTLDVPATAGGRYRYSRRFPRCAPILWTMGHADHSGVACGCHSSDRTGAYIHAVTAAHGGSAGLRPSLTCAHINPAPLQDTADCSSAAGDMSGFRRSISGWFCSSGPSECVQPFSGAWVQPAVFPGIQPIIFCMMRRPLPCLLGVLQCVPAPSRSCPVELVHMAGCS